MVDMDCGRDIDGAAEAWGLLRSGDVEGAAGLVGRWQEPEDGDPTGVPAPDVCLAQAHIALVEGSYAGALSCAMTALGIMGAAAGDADGELEELARSFQLIIAAAGDGVAGLAGKRLASFASPDDAKRASGTYSGLSTRLYLTRPIPPAWKADLIKHFALCAVACDTALMEMCKKHGSVFSRLRRRKKNEAERAPVAQPLPRFEVAGDVREACWDARAGR